MRCNNKQLKLPAFRMFPQVARLGILLFFLLFQITLTAVAKDKREANEPRVTSEEAEILRQIEILADTDIQGAIGKLRMNMKKDANPAMLYALGVLHLRNDQLALAEVTFAETVQRHPGFIRARRNLANVLVAQNKLDAARRELQTILKQAPDLSAAKVVLGEILLEQNKTDEAMTVLQQVLTVHPDNVHAHLIIASICITKQAWAEAEKHLETVLKQRPNDLQSRRNLAATFVEQKKWKEAVFHLEFMLKNGATENDVHANLVYALVEQDKNHEARNHVLSLAEDPEADLDPVNLVVQAYVDKNQKGLAVTLLQNILRLHSNAQDMRELLAGLLLTNGKMADGISELRTVLKSEPERLSARRVLIDALIQNKAYEAAIPELKHLLDSPDEDKGKLWIRLGNTHRLLNQHASAVTAYQHALEYGPEATSVRLAMIRSILDLGDLKRAETSIRRELARDPLQYDLWQLLANIALRQGNQEGALAWLECAREFGGSNVESLLTQGDLLLKNGLFNEALQRYRETSKKEKVSMDRLLRALEGLLAAGRPDAAESLAKDLTARKNALSIEQHRRLQICNAQIAEMNKNPETALAMYQEILKNAPLDSTVLIAAADHLRRQGNFIEALEYYERVARISTKQKPLALVRQAQIAVEQKNYDRAVNLLERSLAIHHQVYVARYLTQVRHLLK